MYKRLLAGSVLALFYAGAVQASNIITFEGFDKGTIIDDEFVVSNGVTINGVNVDRGASNMAVIFDSNASSTADPDLEAPFYNTNGQNLGVANPGNVLIIHEHPSECNGITCGDDPDDEGSRPAGYFDIIFDQPVTLNSIDFFDVESGENGNTSNNLITVLGTGTYDPFYTPNTGGDNTWARLYFNLVGVTSLKIKLHGSGAIDNIDYSLVNVPAPGTLALFVLGLIAVWSGRSRARSSARPLAQALV